MVTPTSCNCCQCFLKNYITLFIIVKTKVAIGVLGHSAQIRFYCCCGSELQANSRWRIHCRSYGIPRQSFTSRMHSHHLYSHRKVGRSLHVEYIAISGLRQDSERLQTTQYHSRLHRLPYGSLPCRIHSYRLYLLTFRTLPKHAILLEICHEEYMVTSIYCICC